MWDAVLGSSGVRTVLEHAAQRPVHAYLFAGPRGSGVEAGARGFAASLLAPDGNASVWDRVMRSRHPDVIEVDPPETAIRVEHGDLIIREASSSPVEAPGKVILIFDAERMNAQTANKLLKTIEEPGARSTLVLLTASPDELLETVQSRCLRVDFPALSEAAVSGALVADGVEPERAELVARLVGGRLDRARALVGTQARVRDSFVIAPTRIDGTGGTAIRISEELGAVLAEAVAAVRSTHEAQSARLEEEIEGSGYPERAAQALRKRQAEQHKRQERRSRIDALLEGVAALETVYRDALVAPAPPLNTDRGVLDLAPESAMAGIDACQRARDSMEFNPNESLLLERLCLGLPRPALPRRDQAEIVAPLE